MLEIKGLSACVGGREFLKEIDLHLRHEELSR